MPQNHHQIRRTRARLVCSQCHDRKLRCDLETRAANGAQGCSTCLESSSFCEARAPQRRKRRTQGAENRGHFYAAIRPATDQPLAQAGKSVQQQDLSEEPSSFHFPDAQYQEPTDAAFSTTPVACQSEASVAPAAYQSLPPPTNPETDLQEDSSIVSPNTVVGYLGETGILKLFQPDSRRIAITDPGRPEIPIASCGIDLPPLELQQSFVETYFEYCWPWCPVLDKSTLWHSLETSPSPLLVNAIALLGTRLRPPIMKHAEASEYYSRAKMLFYTDQESNPIVSLQAIILFYWWAPRGPSLVHKDAAWWWTGLAIKYAQQMGMHREPRDVQDVGGPSMQGLRRRIWWTLFARERLTALCQGRPCTINPDDCSVREPSLEDFGPSETDPRAHVFIHWVRLCAIIGRVGQHMTRNTTETTETTTTTTTTTTFPTSLAQELIEWIRTLPEHLSLPNMSDRIRSFDRDALKLHLPYLTTITLLHINFTSQHPQQPFPEAHTAAVLAASCVARIFRDLLARSQIRFLGANACWHVGVAIVALLHTQRIERLASSGAEDIRILRLALNELASLWPSTAIFVQGFERLRVFENLGGSSNNNGGEGRMEGMESNGTRSAYARTAAQGESSAAGPPPSPPPQFEPLSDPDRSHGIDFQSFFPFITERTDGLTGILLAEHHQAEWWEDVSWLVDPTMQLQSWFDPSDALIDSCMDML